MNEQLFQAMRQSIIDGAPETAAQLARESVAAAIPPLDAITHGFAEGISFAGDQYGCGQMFLPDLLACAEAMKAAMNILEPELRRLGSKRESQGRVVLGTAQGDIHDIGKNLVATILSANGFEIFDLGISVAPDRFIAKAREVDAHIIGVSALLTTTMAGQKSVIEALDRAGLRPKVKAVIGGAAVTANWAREIRADGYARNAMDALDLMRQLTTTQVNA